VNSHSLGIKITDPKNPGRKINHIMIPKNSPVPNNVKQRFGTNSPGQQRIHVEILEGDAIDPAACELIGDFRVFNLPPNLPKGSRLRLRTHTMAQAESARQRLSWRGTMWPKPRSFVTVG